MKFSPATKKAINLGLMGYVGARVLMLLMDAGAANALAYPGHQPRPTLPQPTTISQPANPATAQFPGYCHTSQVATSHWMKSDGFDCQVVSRTNSNGHLVWDITDRHGWKTTVVMWDNGKADVIQSNGTFRADWIRGNDGRVELYAEQGEYSMAFPQL